MFSKLMALVGFAPSEAQDKTPPLLAYLGLLGLAYWSAYIVEWIAQLLGPTFSIYMRTVGLTATILVVHGFYRAIVHNDDASFGGWLRKVIKR